MKVEAKSLLTAPMGVLSCRQQTRQASVLRGMLKLGGFLFFKQVAPQSRWRQRLTAPFAEYKDIPLRFMGFPDTWET